MQYADDVALRVLSPSFILLWGKYVNLAIGHEMIGIEKFGQRK